MGDKLAAFKLYEVMMMVLMIRLIHYPVGYLDKTEFLANSCCGIVTLYLIIVLIVQTIISPAPSTTSVAGWYLKIKSWPGTSFNLILNHNFG